MFERDKAELRELGVPLETGRTPRSTPPTATGSPATTTSWARSTSSRTRRPRSALAARLWESPGLAGAAHGALLKLRAAGVEVDETGLGPVQPRVRAVEPAFGPLLAAVQAGRR